MTIERTTRQTEFDPTPRLYVTKPIEQMLVLLLALHEMEMVESLTAVAAVVGQRGFWRFDPPDWEAVWQNRCLGHEYVKLVDGQYVLTRRGAGRLQDLGTLAYAMRDPFCHLAAAGFQAVCVVPGRMKGKRLFDTGRETYPERFL